MTFLKGAFGNSIDFKSNDHPFKTFKLCDTWAEGSRGTYRTGTYLYFNAHFDLSEYSILQP